MMLFGKAKENHLSKLCSSLADLASIEQRDSVIRALNSFEILRYWQNVDISCYSGFPSPYFIEIFCKTKPLYKNSRCATNEQLVQKTSLLKHAIASDDPIQADALQISLAEDRFVELLHTYETLENRISVNISKQSLNLFEISNNPINQDCFTEYQCQIDDRNNNLEQYRSCLSSATLSDAQSAFDFLALRKTNPQYVEVRVLGPFFSNTAKIGLDRQGIYEFLKEDDFLLFYSIESYKKQTHTVLNYAIENMASRTCYAICNSNFAKDARMLLQKDIEERRVEVKVHGML